MAACQSCGTPCPDDVRVCVACGRPLVAGPGAKPIQRTLLGGLDGRAIAAAAAAAAPAQAQPHPGHPQQGTMPSAPTGALGPQRTLLGVARPYPDAPAPQAGARLADLTRTQPVGTPHAAQPQAAHPYGGTQRIDPLTDPVHALPTMVDVRSPVHVPGPEAGSGQAPSTLLGVARPGIAPLAPGVRRDDAREKAPPGYRPLEELGATQPPALRKVPAPPASRPDAHPLGRRRLDKIAPARGKGAPAKAGPSRQTKVAITLVAVAGALALVAVLIVLFWPHAPPLEARVRAGEAGAEIVDVTCPSCPDGTVLRIRESIATVEGGRASVPLGAQLAMGDTPVRIGIDRPGSGRDETVGIELRVAYRIRPDLTTLDADRPALQVVVEAMEGAQITLDGEAVPLLAGRAVKSIDVSKDLLRAPGESGDVLARKIDYVVTPPDGPEERGVVAVTVSILPLDIQSPGRAVVTSETTFLLAGKTMPGAELVVSGRPIPVAADGSFSQHMNVSSIGATQIEVRARGAGKAPRLGRVAVQRVASLEEAARSFLAASPLGVAGAAADPAASRGKSIAVEGEVVERSVEAHRTVLVVRADGPGCPQGGDACLVRLVQGGIVTAEKGTRLRAFGAVAGVVRYGQRDVVDVDVAFSLPGGKP